MSQLSGHEAIDYLHGLHSAIATMASRNPVARDQTALMLARHLYGDLVKTAHFTDAGVLEFTLDPPIDYIIATVTL